MIIHNVKQGSDEWFALKAGKFSASRFDKLLMGKSTQGYDGEIFRVAYGKITGKYPKDEYKSKYMQDGNDYEAIARRRYEFETFDDVVESGFYELNEFVGCSLDGVVDNNKNIEIKCPKYNTMMKYLLKPETLYKDYDYQVQGQLWISERESCDMVAYHPELRLLIHPVKRDDVFIKKLKSEVEIAIKKVEEIIKQLGEK